MEDTAEIYVHINTLLMGYGKTTNDGIAYIWGSTNGVQNNNYYQ